ncbi:hypothetical protein PR048_018511, partial [Dryococelus australis]
MEIISFSTQEKIRVVEMVLNRERYQLHYILIQKRYRNCLKNAKAYPGAGINSDHNLVVGEIQVKLKKVERGKARERLNLETLKDVSKASELEDRFMEKCQSDRDEECINLKWIKMREGLMTSAIEVLGIRESKSIRKEWITENMLKKMEERRKWKNTGNEEGRKRYRKLNNALRRGTEQRRERWMKEKCEEIEKVEKEGKYEMMYRMAREIAFEGKGRKRNMEIEKVGGTLAKELHEVKRIERGYGILEAEVEKALKVMKNRKACGNNLPAEVLESLGNRGRREILYLCNDIYDKGEWSDDFLTT